MRERTARTTTGALAAILLLAAAAAAQDGDPFRDLRAADPATRERGLAALAAAGEPALLRALADPSPLVRAAAASVVEAKPAAATPGILGALRQALRDGKAGPTVRGAAARALAAARDVGAARDLRDALEAIPADASLALAVLGDGNSLAALRARREADPAAAPPELGYALAVLGDPAGEDLLLERLGSPDPAASTAALHLLRRLTGRDLEAPVPAWQEAIRLRRLGAALGDRDPERADAALDAAVARGAAAVPDLVALLADTAGATETRGKAALGLGLLGSAEAGPALLAASLRGQDPWVRVYALEALGRIAWAPAAPVLARMLVDDEDAEVPQTFADSRGPFHMVQSAAIRALLAMGCEGALAAVVEQISGGGLSLLPVACVGDFRIRVYYEARAILRDYGGPGAKEAFGFSPESVPAERAAAAARAVAWWRSKPADLAVPVRAGFGDPLFAARVNREIEILGQYKFLEMDRSRRALALLGRPALPFLAAAVAVPPADDPAGQRRIGASQVLALMGHAEGAAPIRAALARAENPSVRCQLLLSLARLGPAEGVGEAARLLESAVDAERAAAAEALSLCPTPSAAAALARARARPGADRNRLLDLASALLAIRDPSGVPDLLAGLAHGDPIHRRRAWEGLDRWVDGLGPFDPEAAPGPGAEAVRARWDAAARAPAWRRPAAGGR